MNGERGGERRQHGIVEDVLLQGPFLLVMLLKGRRWPGAFCGGPELRC